MISGNYTYTTIAAGTTDEAGVAATAGLRLMGLSIRETAGSGATVNIEHGTANSSPIMVAYSVGALSLSAATTYWFGPQGLPCEGGIWIERLTGTTSVHLITTID